MLTFHGQSFNICLHFSQPFHTPTDSPPPPPQTAHSTSHSPIDTWYVQPILNVYTCICTHIPIPYTHSFHRQDSSVSFPTWLWVFKLLSGPVGKSLQGISCICFLTLGQRLGLARLGEAGRWLNEYIQMLPGWVRTFDFLWGSQSFVCAVGRVKGAQPQPKSERRTKRPLW